MIFVDASIIDTLKLAGCRSMPKLAEETGAHIVVSEKSFPPAGALVKKHIDAGSAFISVVQDWKVRPLGVYKMFELGVTIKYNVIHGVVTPDLDGAATQDGVNVGFYKDFVEKCARQTVLGVNVVNIEREFLPSFVSQIESEMMLGNLLFMPTATRGFLPIKDWRATLAAIPLISLKRSQELWDAYRQDTGEEYPPLLDVIRALTDPARNQKPISKVVCAGMRAWFGVPDGFNLSLEMIEDE